MVLEEILERKRQDVRERMARRPLAAFSADLRPSDRSLRAAFRPGRTAFILECKKASPSRGLIRADFDPVRLAEAFDPVADAISVLADEPFFQGSLADVRRVRERVSLPVLCKDFVVDPYQVYEARLHGADAVLLMLSVLDNPTATACLEAARSLAQDTLVEVHDEAELRRALALGAGVVGINNRDFRTLRTDLAVTERLAPLVPPGVALVCESGIRGRADVARLRRLAGGFLVGTSLMETPDPGRAARELVFGRVKVCGLTSPADAAAAWRAGAVYGGLIFAAESPRCVTPEQARRVRDAAPLRWAGVFVNAPIDRVRWAVVDLDLAVVQLHGEEDAGYVRTLKAALPPTAEVWKAHRVAGPVPAPAAREARGIMIPALAASGADRLLLDTQRSGRRGGTGETFDWSVLRDHPERDRLVVAGGIRPANAREAATLGAFALDVNSGVESAPGVKDEGLLLRLFEELRG